jgi:ParB-like chromosome segregation protein Spo0J
MVTPTMTALDKIKPAEWNPRLLKDDRFKKLCKSMEEEKDFLWCRPIIANKDGTIIGGNMRYRAASHLKWKEIPVSFIDVSDIQAKKLAILDNGQFGEWTDELAEIINELQEAGVDIETLGLDNFSMPDVADGFTLPDGEKAPFQQMTFTLHDEQVEQVEEAMKIARGMGEFNSPNENGNGNALARICETFLTDHA